MKVFNITQFTFEKLTVQFREEYISSYFLVIHTTEEIKGYFGPLYKPYISTYMELLRPLLGMNPLHIEVIWEIIWKSQIGGRTGLFMEFLSAVDCALWDIKGKYFKCATFEVLGGPTRNSVPCYASMLGFRENTPDSIKIAKEYFHKGFKNQKWPIRSHNHKNVRDQIQTIQQLVKAVPDCNFSFDIFGQWNITDYHMFLQTIDEVNISWLEEPLIPEQSLTSIPGKFPLAIGEHLYNIFEFKDIISNEQILYLQPDIGRCGGFTEALRIISLAKAFGKMVVPHGHNLQPAINIAMANHSNIMPMVEYHVTIEPRRQCFYKYPIKVEDGKVVMDEFYGSGVEYDERKIIEKKYLVSII